MTLDFSPGNMVTVDLYRVDEVIVSKSDGKSDELHKAQSSIAGEFRRGQWLQESPLGAQELGKKLE